MFAPKKVLVRILKPNTAIIDSKFCAVPLPTGEIVILVGDFEDIQDVEALTLAAHAATRANVA